MRGHFVGGLEGVLFDSSWMFESKFLAKKIATLMKYFGIFFKNSIFYSMFNVKV